LDLSSVVAHIVDARSLRSIGMLVVTASLTGTVNELDLGIKNAIIRGTALEEGGWIRVGKVIADIANTFLGEVFS
jgi:hypothetical protein